jgi:proteasome accessory factor C
MGTMDRFAARLNRMLLMVPLILREEGASIEELCRALGVDRKELMADLNTLWLCGLPSYTPLDLIDRRIEGDRVYLSMADYFRRPLTVTRQEALTLLVAGRTLIGAGFFEEEGPLASALEKVEGMLSQEQKGDVEDIARRIEVELDSYPGKWWKEIETGIGSAHNILLEYYSYSRDTVSEREVEPFSLVWSRGQWYLMAWCHLAEDKRLFRLDRIKSVAPTEHQVTRSAGGEFYVPELVGEYRPGRKAHNVKLRFFGKEGRRLAEEWPAALFTDNPDGSVAVEFRTRNLIWLSNYLLKFGDRFRIDSPGELKAMLKDKVERLLEVYVQSKPQKG